MKPFKRSMLLVLAVGLVWAAFHTISHRLRGLAALQVTFLSVSNDTSGGQCALFSVSNRTARDVTYMSDGTPQPLYSLTHWEIAPNAIRATNYNTENVEHAKPAKLVAHTSLTFPVYIPAGVTDAILELSYQRELRRSESLKEKARSLVESYGGKLPLSAPQTWTNIQVPQPFR